MNVLSQSIQDIPAPELARVIAVSNGFCRDEHSSIPVNLAICLAQMGKKVCVFDANELPPERLMLSVNSQILSMDKLLAGDIAVDALIHEGPGGIKIIPHTTSVDEYSSLSADQKENLLFAITQLQHDFDYLLIDTAAEINNSTISFVLGAGSIVITITPEAESLKGAFALLKCIRQRTFQQPVQVIVNLVSGEAESKNIIARFSVAVRKYLGRQCGSLSFFIINQQILNFISQQKLITLEYPNSLPSHCLKNISLSLAEKGQTESIIYPRHLTEFKSSRFIETGTPSPQAEIENGWLNEALNSIQSQPLSIIDPVMKKLNKIWNQRKMLKYEDSSKTPVFELELLKLKTAIHFASHIEVSGQKKVAHKTASQRAE